jgi:CMP/dCMP kinase
MVDAPVPVIAIDGPSGVGKGTVARAVAAELGWHFLDSGALYRILALAAFRAGVDLRDAAAVAAQVPGLNIEFATSGDGIVVNGEDITRAARAEDNGSRASVIASLPPVRQVLLQRQHDFRRPPGLVADGRDMGTVVFPDAGVKVFLDATPDERARRRWLQLGGDKLSTGGSPATLADLCAEIRARDARDRGRSHAPLRPADDAVVIDTTDIPPQAVISRVMELVRARQLAVPLVRNRKDADPV